MKPLNTLPIEIFLEKTKIASKTNQKFLNLEIKEAQALADSLSIIMTRLAGNLDQKLSNSQESSSFEVKMDGGKF